MDTHMNSYTKFLHLKQTLDFKHKSKPMNLKAEKLLEQIAISFTNESPLTISEAMGLESIASPATLHKKITELISNGWIKTVFEGINKRTKYLVPTTQLNNYYVTLSKLMAKS